ncbi:MAG: energy transducer TonB [Aureibaculum sp.]|nr:energy transducer TonB [Aureibaculum sp.]
MKITILFACLICTSMMCQDLKKKKKSGISYQEIFTVDKDSKERQGYYYKINKFSKDTLAKGKFEQGEQVGVWSFMGEKNSLYLKYDYDQNKLLKHNDKTLGRDSIHVKIGNDFKITIVDNPPIYLGYKNEIKHVIREELKPPTTIFKEAKSGMVVASFEVNQMGEVENFKIESSSNDKINEATVNSIENIKYGWIPASINGVPVISKMYIIYNFNFISDPNNRPKLNFKDKADLIVVNLTYFGVKRERKVYSN